MYLHFVKYKMSRKPKGIWFG